MTSLRDKLLCDGEKCYICGVINKRTLIKKTKKFRNLIEVHHIIEKNDNGTDSCENLIPVCSNCHSKIHEGIIKLDKWYFSTRGWIFHFYDELGNEVWGK